MRPSGTCERDPDTCGSSLPVGGDLDGSRDDSARNCCRPAISGSGQTGYG